MHNDVVGKWDSSLNIKLIHIYLEHNLKDYFYFFIVVCVHDAYVWEPVPRQESGSQRPSPLFSPLFEGSEVRILAAKLVPQELYPLRHLIGLSLKQFYTIVLAYIVFCLRPIRRDQLGIFFHT